MVLVLWIHCSVQMYLCKSAIYQSPNTHKVFKKLHYFHNQGKHWQAKWSKRNIDKSRWFCLRRKHTDHSIISYTNHEVVSVWIINLTSKCDVGWWWWFKADDLERLIKGESSSVAAITCDHQQAAQQVRILCCDNLWQLTYSQMHTAIFYDLG